MTADRVLLDTSLLIAASVEEHPSHGASVAYLDRLADHRTPTCITPQICREFMSVLTRAAIGPRAFSVPEALQALQVWRTNCGVLGESEPVLQRWLQLVEQFQVRGKQVHDAHIVATMLSHDVARIATWNIIDFERYGDLLQVEPIIS
jgi:toxin-antitoxin system PIN domain toxin